MSKWLLGLLMTCLFTTVIANAEPMVNSSQQNTMSLQIIKQQFNLTKQSIKSVQLVKLSNGEYAVRVELTQDAAKLMNDFSAKNINHEVYVVWQNRIITSPIIRAPLGAKFEITGFNEEQAKNFVKAMQS